MIGRALLVIGSVLFGLLFLEIGCRAVRGTDSLLHWKNIVLDQRQGMASQNLDSRFAYDPLLGYTQRPSFAAAELTYDRNGYRNMPPVADGTPDGPPILATGDSYTQGDEVPDNQTWP